MWMKDFFTVFPFFLVDKQYYLDSITVIAYYQSKGVQYD
jgi:hypothetical protein